MSTAFEKATDVLAVMRPSEAWQLVARSDKQFLLVGDSDHGNYRIVREVVRAVPRLAKAGFVHMGMERYAPDHEAAFTAFHHANSRQRRSGSDLRKLSDHMAGCFNAHIADERESMAAMFAEFDLQVELRRHGMTPHCIRLIPDIQDMIERRYPPGRAARYMDLLDYSFMHAKWPEDATRNEVQAAERVYDAFEKKNMHFDRQRARHMREVTGQDRAIVFYGAGHFRVSKTEGIDKHLPPDSSVNVMVEHSKTVASDLRYEFRQHRGSVPDVVVTTDTRQAWVLPPARRNGLWHG